jgi:hypothetical protein
MKLLLKPLNSSAFTSAVTYELENSVTVPSSIVIRELNTFISSTRGGNILAQAHDHPDLKAKACLLRVQKPAHLFLLSPFSILFSSESPENIQ